MGIIVNVALTWTRRWLDRKRLQMAVEKTEAILVTDRRAFVKQRLELVGLELDAKHLTHLGIQLDNILKFEPHLDVSPNWSQVIKANDKLRRNQ